MNMQRDVRKLGNVGRLILSAHYHFTDMARWYAMKLILVVCAYSEINILVIVDKH